MKSIQKNKKRILKIIGWYQIIGGITGLLLISKLLLNTGTLNGPVLLIFLIGLGLFIFSFYAGKTLLKSAGSFEGINLSIINQVLQLFQWSLFGYGLTYSSGGEIVIGFKFIAVTFDLSIIVSSFEMYINSNPEFYIKINLIAAFLIVLLYYLKKDPLNSNLNKNDL